MTKGKKIITLALLAIFTISCGLPVISTLSKDLPVTQPSATPRALLATPTQKTIVTVGNWHLRKQPSPNGASVIIPDRTTVSVIRSVGGWHEVNVTINGTKYSGWVHINSEGKQKSPVDD